VQAVVQEAIEGVTVGARDDQGSIERTMGGAIN
jgi:hypothetical protein